MQKIPQRVLLRNWEKPIVKQIVIQSKLKCIKREKREKTDEIHQRRVVKYSFDKLKQENEQKITKNNPRQLLHVQTKRMINI